MFSSRASPRNCHYILVSLIILLSASTLEKAVAIGGQAETSRPAKLFVDGPRPIAKAIEQLEDKYGWIITYEDVRYSHESDLVDVTHPEYRKAHPSAKALLPRWGQIEINYTVSTKTGSPDNPVEVIQKVLNNHVAKGNPGVLALKQAGEVLHIVPVKVKNSRGQMVNISAILDVPISLPEEERPPMAIVEAICQALSRETQTTVFKGTAPLNLHQRIRVGAANEPARDVLTRTLANTKRRLSWKLYYDPTLKVYALNINPVRDPLQGKIDPTGRRY